MLNPYAYQPPPSTPTAAPPLLRNSDTAKPEVDLEHQLRLATRKKHAATEFWIRRIGLFYFVMAVLICFSLVVATLTATTEMNRGGNSLSLENGLARFAFERADWLVLFLGGIAQGYYSMGIMKLDEKRIGPGLIISFFWLPTLVGTIPSLLYIILVTSTKGEFIFTPEYKKIVESTPGVW